MKIVNIKSQEQKVGKIFQEYANIAIKILDLSIQIFSKLIKGLSRLFRGYFSTILLKMLVYDEIQNFYVKWEKNDILSALEFICNLQKFVCVYTITDKSESWSNHVQFICPHTVWTNILAFIPSQTATKCFQWLIIYLHCLLCKLFRDVYIF